MLGYETVGRFRGAGKGRGARIPIEQPMGAGLAGQRAEGCFGAAVNCAIRFDQVNSRLESLSRQFGETGCYGRVLKREDSQRVRPW